MNAKVYKMTIHEILQKVSDAKTAADRIAVLQEYNCLALRDILKGGLDENVHWLLPPGAPAYESGQSFEGVDISSLHQKTKLLSYFVKGGPNQGIKQMRLEKMFLEILEAIPKVDAEVLIFAKDRKLHRKYKGVTRVTVEAAFPKLLSPLAKTAKAVKVEDPVSSPASTPVSPEPIVTPGVSITAVD